MCICFRSNALPLFDNLVEQITEGMTQKTQTVSIDHMNVRIRAQLYKDEW